METETPEKKTSKYKALCQTLVKYRVVNPRRNESPEYACAKLLRKADKTNLPTTVLIKSKDGDPSGSRYLPYRIFPTAALESLNRCVRFLEYCLQIENTPRTTNQKTKTNPYKDNKIREGVLQLAILLIPNCLVTPEQIYYNPNRTNTPEDAGGGTLLHRANPKDPTHPILTKRARILKNLLGRLEKYEFTHLNLQPNPKSTSEPLLEIHRLQTLFNQEVKASLNSWKKLRDEIEENTRSLEDMGFAEEQKALTYEPTEEPEEMENLDFSNFDPNDDPLDQEEYRNDQIQTAHYYGESPSDPESNEETSQEKTRRNLPCEPDGWLWQDTVDPMVFITSYVHQEILPRIEQKKEDLLAIFSNTNLSQSEKEKELLIIPEKKYNPNDFWKILGNLAKNSPEEDQQIREKLASARFAVCLRETNRAMGVPHTEFLQAWEQTIREHLSGKNPKPSRNHALQSTLQNLPSCGNWKKEKLDQWLETLQTLAPGGYENTAAQEINRHQIIETLNQTLGRIREGMETQREGETQENLETLLNQVAQGITKSLSGPSGQTVRRELRYHIKSLKDEAVERKNTEEVENFKSLWQWITSISKQIKTGDWYLPETQKAAHKVVRGMIIDILAKEIDKKNEKIFKTSPIPEGKSELELCIEFLKSISGDDSSKGFAGRSYLDKKIQGAAAQLVESRQKNLGTTLTPKEWSKNHNVEDLPNKIRAGLVAEKLLTEIPTENKLQALFSKTGNHLKALFGQEECNPPITQEENLAFWNAMFSIGENILMRKEDPKYKPSPLGKKMLLSCANLAKDNYTGIQTVSDYTRENLRKNSKNMVLLANAIVPIGLWILAPSKGKNAETPHEEIVKSFQKRRKQWEEINKLFSQKNQEDLKNQLKSEIVITFSVNLSALDETAKFCKNPIELAEAILWQHRNPEEALLLGQKFPQKDSPIERMNLAKSKATPKPEQTVSQEMQ